MKFFFISVLITAVLASCNKKIETSEANATDSSGVFIDEESAADSTLAATTGCYMQVTGKDTLFAQIDDNLGTVTGKLHYKNHQKDNSFGEILGASIGDTIKVDYTFQAEGKRSTREIWFLKKEGKLLEGLGDFDKAGEKYEDYKKIKFEGGHVLDAVECKKIENKFPELKLQKASATALQPAEKEEAKQQPVAKQTEKTQPKPTDKPDKNVKKVKTKKN